MERSSRVYFDEEGNLFIEGINVIVKDKTFNMSKEFGNAMKEAEIRYKNDAITEEEYYKLMEHNRNEFLEKGTKEWWTYTNKLIEYDNKVIAEKQKALDAEMKMIEGVYTEIATFAYDTQEEVRLAQESFREKLRGETDTTYSVKRVFVGLGQDGKDLVFNETTLSDLDPQKEGLREYYNLLTAVKERGEAAFSKEGFKEFFNYLRNLSVEEGGNLAGLLLKENDEGFLDFVGDWNEIQSITEAFSKDIYKDDTEGAVQKTMEFMKQRLSEEGLSIPDGFFVTGSASAEKFGEGFVSKLSSVVTDISNGFDSLFLGEKALVRENGEEYNGNVFAPVYNIYGGGETVAEKLRSAKAQSIVDKMRGGY